MEVKSGDVGRDSSKALVGLKFWQVGGAVALRCSFPSAID